MAVLSQYDYIFGIGTIFALLEAFNNGANDVANSWATSVSSRSISYPVAMVCAFVFELLGALTVGARTASTIKNGIISSSAFKGDGGVALLAFACAAFGAGTWVMFCSRKNITVSSTYALVSSLIGVGIATVGNASGVRWGWEGGNGVGAIFAGLLMAPAISAAFGAIIFMLIKVVVHMRKDPVKWAVWTSPFFFLVAGTICTLTIVYKGSPKLGLSKKPTWYIVAVTLGVGFGLAAMSALFFLPFVYAKVIKKDYTLKAWEVIKGPLLWKRPAPADASVAKVPDFSVIQHDDEEDAKREPVVSEQVLDKSVDVNAVATGSDTGRSSDVEKAGVHREMSQEEYKELMRANRERHHAKLRASRTPLGWAMRVCHNNPIGAGGLYELKNVKALIMRLPAYPIIGLLYGTQYDIHSAQVGIQGTPDWKRMERTYANAPKYGNDVEYLYSFIQIITACTASFAHGANDVGNAVGVWAGMYAAWTTGKPPKSSESVPLWQIAVMVLALCFGFMTYGYNIMKVMGNKITYHSPSRGSSMEMGAAITVMVFSQYKLPVSTTMCITGATVGVGLCNGNLRAVNWHRVLLVLLSWVLTVPFAGLLGGCSMGLMLNSPHFP